METVGVDFKWGAKKRVGVSLRDRDFQYYESFTYRGIKYSRYDYAYFYLTGEVNSRIGKLMKLYETPAHERKVEALWLFNPMHIRKYLGDVEPKYNELFLASGRGESVYNTNDVEKIVGQCHVICTSKDKRNPQVSRDELSKADYFFYRTFDVGKRIISDKFPDEIAGIKVEFLFDRREDQKLTRQELQKPCGQVNVPSRIEPRIGPANPAKNLSENSGKSFLLKNLQKGPSIVGARKSCASEILNLKPSIERGTKPGRETKDISKVRSLGDAFTENIEDPVPLKKRTGLMNGENSISLQGSIKAAKAIKASQNPGTQPAFDRSLKNSKQVTEVTGRPDDEKRNWFKNLPWDERLRRAQQAGTLVLLENLDPSFSSFEVEDLVQLAFKEKVAAQMIPSGTFSRPLYGKAFVIFKSKLAAENALKELQRRYLILTDGRPVIGRRRNLRVPGEATSFPGHLVIDKLKLRRQSYDVRTAVSTAHCSQPNSLEYFMALQWLELQEKSDLSWQALYKGQLEEINDIKSQLKPCHNG